MHDRPHYKVTLKDGRVLDGQVHGSGGVVATDQRCFLVIRGRAMEEMDIPIAGSLAGLRYTLPENKDHLGNVGVWTDPDAVEPKDRMTKVKASEIARVDNLSGEQVWPRPPRGRA
jgi:hypothetical protein